MRPHFFCALALCLVLIFSPGVPADELRPALLRIEQCRARAHPPLMSCVVVFDTDDLVLGKFLQTDYANLSKFLLTPVRQHGQLGDCRLLLGSSATPSNVIREIQSVAVGRNDTFLVFFAGHGRIHMNDGIQYLLIKGGELSHLQVAQEMANKHARLSILVTDCCSKFDLPSQHTKTNQDIAKATNWDTIKQLFFDLQGRVTVTSAQPGQPSWASVFTLAFCWTLTDSPIELHLGEKGNWSRFFQQVNIRTKPSPQVCTFFFGPWKRW